MNRDRDRPTRDDRPTWWSDALLVGFAVILILALLLVAITCGARCAS